jgi:hypothetical protein
MVRTAVFLVASLIVVVPSPCFALWLIAPVSKERAKEMDMEVRSMAAGPNHLTVELDFSTEGALKGFSRVDLRIGEGDNPPVTAPLREDRSKPGRALVGFTAAGAELPKLTLWVYVPDLDGGSIYKLQAKDFVELKKEPKGTTDMEFEFHRGKVPATELKVELAAGKNVVKERRGLVLPLTITNASGEAIKTTLAHEWHGGEWPPTSLFASVTPIADKESKPFAPVYLAGEDQEAPRAFSLATGKSTDVELRVDWPGTGSVKGDPLIQKPGKYVVQFALVFEAGGKKQHAASAPIEVEYKSE